MSDQNQQVLQSSFVLSEVDNDEQMVHIKKLVADQLEKDTEDFQLIGNRSADSLITVTAHLIWLFRKHGVHKNEREMVLSYEETLIVVQLCLAEDNKLKTGEFDVEASKVIEMHNYLINDKLGLSSTVLLNDEYKTFRQQYHDYLQQSNLIDCMDVLCRLTEEVNVNEALKNEIEKSNFIVFNSTANKIEKAMLAWLSKNKQCYTTTSECSLDDSFIDSSTYKLEPICDIMEKLNNIQNTGINTPANTGGRSITETYAEKVFVSYLHLLVNTRSEIALALVLNTPERDLNHKAFTAVKREAKTKKMSMYQVIVSHVMRVRLGGKSYVPKTQSPLNYHIKGLAEFTDLMHKIMNIIEEETNTRTGVTRVLNILKNTILKCKDNHLRRESIESVTVKLREFAETTIDDYEKVAEESPKRDAYHGGSLIGRRTLRVIQAIVDRFCSRLPGKNTHVDLLTDTFSSQATPIRFTSLISKFRSPLEASPGSMESQSLVERMRNKMNSQCAKPERVPRFQSSMDWALPVHSVGIQSRQTCNSSVMEDYIPSKTVVHPAVKSSKDSIARKVLESIHDQENADESMGTVTTEIPKKTQKRKTLAVSSELNQPAAKKPKKTAAAKPKKKAVALQKGQKQLTAFFRV